MGSSRGVAGHSSLSHAPAMLPARSRDGGYFVAQANQMNTTTAAATMSANHTFPVIARTAAVECSNPMCFLRFPFFCRSQPSERAPEHKAAVRPFGASS